MQRSMDTFFGTNPTGEQMRSGKGSSLNGPTMHPSCTSFCSLSLITCGSWSTVIKNYLVFWVQRGLYTPNQTHSGVPVSHTVLCCCLSLIESADFNWHWRHIVLL